MQGLTGKDGSPLWRDEQRWPGASLSRSVARAVPRGHQLPGPAPTPIPEVLAERRGQRLGAGLARPSFIPERSAGERHNPCRLWAYGILGAAAGGWEPRGDALVGGQAWRTGSERRALAPYGHGTLLAVSSDAENLKPPPARLPLGRLGIRPG